MASVYLYEGLFKLTSFYYSGEGVNVASSLYVNRELRQGLNNVRYVKGARSVIWLHGVARMYCSYEKLECAGVLHARQSLVVDNSPTY